MTTADKYDRQVRLWGSDAQKSLRGGHVLCLGSSSVITEAAKNIVLTGVGNVTIYDDVLTQISDLGENFFLQASDVGRPRAAAVAPNLQELNPDVSVTAVPNNAPATGVLELVEAHLKNIGLSVSSISLILFHQAKLSQIDPLLNIAWKNKIPCLYCATKGFLGMLRIMKDGSHIILNTKSEDTKALIHDLRIHRPFPALSKYYKEIFLPAFASMTDTQQHSHIPYLLLLLKALNDESIEGAVVTSDQKNAIKAWISKTRWSADEQNFDEALKTCGMMSKHAFAIPEETVEALESLVKQGSGSGDHDTQLLGAAASVFLAFIERNGIMPLSGRLPDMTSDTETYVALQALYRDQAAQEVNELVEQALHQVCEGYKPSSSDEDTRNHEEAAVQGFPEGLRVELRHIIEEFCKNGCSMRNLEYGAEIRPEPGEENPEMSAKVSEIWEDFQGEGESEESLTPWYAALRAILDETGAEKRFLPADVELSKETLARLVDITGEIQGYSSRPGVGTGELHNTSAVMGGVIAQEAIKLMTHQYNPLHNTLLYNGLSGRIEVFDL